MHYHVHVVLQHKVNAQQLMQIVCMRRRVDTQNVLCQNEYQHLEENAQLPYVPLIGM